MGIVQQGKDADERRLFIIEIESNSVGLYKDTLIEKLREVKQEHRHIIKNIKLSEWTTWREDIL